MLAEKREDEEHRQLQSALRKRKKHILLQQNMFFLHLLL